MKRYLNTPEEIMQALKEGNIVKDEYGRAFALKKWFRYSDICRRNAVY